MARSAPLSLAPSPIHPHPLVDCIQVDGGLLLALSPGQEHDPGEGGGDGPAGRGRGRDGLWFTCIWSDKCSHFIPAFIPVLHNSPPFPVLRRHRHSAICSRDSHFTPAFLLTQHFLPPPLPAQRRHGVLSDLLWGCPGAGIVSTRDDHLHGGEGGGRVCKGVHKGRGVLAPV